MAIRQFGIGKMEEEILLKHQVVVATPPAGYVALYTKSDGKIYKKDSSNVETEVGGGSGSSALSIALKTATYNTTSADDYLIFDSSTTCYCNLHALSTAVKALKIKNRGAGAVIIDGNSAEQIWDTNSALYTITLYQGDSVELIPDGTYWNTL